MLPASLKIIETERAAVAPKTALILERPGKGRCEDGAFSLVFCQFVEMLNSWAICRVERRFADPVLQGVRSNQGKCQLWLIIFNNFSVRKW